LDNAEGDENGCLSPTPTLISSSPPVQIETSPQVSIVVVEEEDDDDIESVTVAQGKAQCSNEELGPWKEAEIGRLAQQLEKLGEQLASSQSVSASAAVPVGIGREVDVLEDVPSPFDFDFDWSDMVPSAEDFRRHFSLPYLLALNEALRKELIKMKMVSVPPSQEAEP